MTKDLEDFLQTARERFRASHDAESKFRVLALSDLKFYDGDQWPEEIREQRKDEGRPCLTFPVIQQFVRQVSNDIRRNKPSPVVTPVGHDDVDTAEILMGLVRKVERQSKADVARSYAALYAIVTGRGWYRVSTRYESDRDGGLDPMSLTEDAFDQEIYIERIKNQAGVYPDPTCLQPDYSDMKYCFEVEDWMVADYKAAHPNSAVSGLEDFSSIGDQAIHWCSADTIRIANYWHVETEALKIALIQDPATGAPLVVRLDQVPAGVPVLQQRTHQRRIVKWSRINGVEILEEKSWPIPWIPLLPVLGEELMIDGETSISGMVRSIKSAQQQYNYMRTMQTETIALAPRAPYIPEEGQIEGYEHIWNTANTKNYAYMPYKGVTIEGHLVGAPQRQQFEPAIQAITMAVGQAYEDLKRGSGIHDASLGARSNETSGRAILAREEQGDTANFHFQDNLTTSITHETRMVVALMKFIYDRPGRVARIIGDEGEERTVTLNQAYLEKGEQKLFDITTGRYDVALTVGPSSASRRAQTGELLMQLTKAYPALMAIAGDVMVKSLDIPGGREIGERLKKMLPPELREDEDDDPAANAQKAQQKLAQSAQMIDALTERLELISEEIKTKRIEHDSKERIAAGELAFKREELKAKSDLELAKLGSVEALAELRADLDSVRHKIDLAAQQEQADRAEEMQRETAEREQGNVEADRQAAAEQAEAEQAAALPVAA